MTARIITAVEAQALLKAATPGPWMHNWRGPEDGAPGDLWYTGGCGGPLTREADWELAAQAPDLAASVVALHAEVDDVQAKVDRAVTAERTKIVQYLRTRAEGCEAALSAWFHDNSNIPRYRIASEVLAAAADAIEEGEVP